MAADLFYRELIDEYVRADNVVQRDWLRNALLERIAEPDCRYVVVRGEPGAGKSGLLADLADTHHDWLRCFFRRDSAIPLSTGDAASVLFTLGHQLATLRPALFSTDDLEIVVRQRVNASGESAEVLAVQIADLHASPFHRTAIHVEQEIDNHGGRLVGVEIGQLVTHPRLLSIEVLQHLALLDPAELLASIDPDARIVVLVDAVDEAMRLQDGGILDWLERGPELPANVRFVLSGRFSTRWQSLLDARSGLVSVVDIDTESPEVTRDVEVFSRRLMVETARVPDIDDAVTRLSRAANGNFAYLRAYERALTAAIRESNETVLGSLLDLTTLPSGLASLYSILLRGTRSEIRALGSLDVQQPTGPDDTVTPAWEGAGQRMVAVLAVARAPLSLPQLIRLGGLRVWHSGAETVLQRIVPLLDAVGPGWRLFHTSLAEFITEGGGEVGIDAAEWHSRVLLAYRGHATGWAEVDWDSVDDYGLLHLIDHVAELSQADEAAALVNAGMRNACKARFLSDLHFKRLIDTVRSLQPPDSLATQLFLDIVQTEVAQPELAQPPAVLGLMVRLGRGAEAIARASVLAPGNHQFRCLQAIRDCTAPADRAGLSKHDGVDLLVEAAMAVPESDDGGLVGHRGFARGRLLEDSAIALAPYDLDRALHLVATANLLGPDDARDKVLVAAARHAAPNQVLKYVRQLATGQAKCAIEAAGRASGAERASLLEFAEANLPDDVDDAIVALAGLVAEWHEIEPPRQANAAARLRAAVTSSEWSGDPKALISAAKWIEAADNRLARELLTLLRVDSGGFRTERACDAIKLWASWGESEPCLALAEVVLEYERGLGWYGPAGRIIALATALAPVDPGLSAALDDEGIALIERTVASDPEDEELRRLSFTIAEAIRALRHRDPLRAIELAHHLPDSWSPGLGWQSFGDRRSALAVIAMDMEASDPDLSRRLLDECLAGDSDTPGVGRRRARTASPGGLFRLNAENQKGYLPARDPKVGLVAAYLSNVFNYWDSRGRWDSFRQPVDVARSIDTSPTVASSRVSWAAVIAEAVMVMATTERDDAIALSHWLADPHERLIAAAALVPDRQDHPNAAAALDAVGALAVALPRYGATIDFDMMPESSAIAYQNPSACARWEAAIALPSWAIRTARDLATATGSSYLTVTYEAQRLYYQLAWQSSAEVDDALLGAMDTALAQFWNHPDKLQRDLLIAEVVRITSSTRPAHAHALIEYISHPKIAALVTLFFATDTRDLVRRCEHLMQELPDEVLPVHRASIAAEAARWAREDGAAADRLIAIGVDSLVDRDPLQRALGLTELCWAAAPDMATDLVLAALDAAEQIDNNMLAEHVFARLVGPAFRTGDAGLIVQIARRALMAGWEVLVEGLRRGVTAMLQYGGIGLISALDIAFRAADAVLTGPRQTERGHVDGVALPSFRNARSEPRRAPMPLDVDDVAELYCTAEDLPPGVTLLQNSLDLGSDPGDYAFGPCLGRHAGLRVWQGDDDLTIQRICDIRFVFPDAESAALYHRERLLANSEASPPLADAVQVGDECHVFGGIRSIAPGIDIAMVYYLFRVGPVVVKLFASQGVKAEDTLTPHSVAAMAQRAKARCETYGYERP